MCDEEVAALVVDNGSGMCKVSYFNNSLLKMVKINFFNNPVLFLVKTRIFILIIRFFNQAYLRENDLEIIISGG